MSIVKINSGQVRFQNPTGVVFFPWNGAGGTLGTDGYDVHDIVGDTFSLTQDDPERNEIPWEFGDDPLDENVSLGNKNVTMQCLDFQNSIMQNIFGWNIASDSDFVFAPAGYQDVWCTILLQFEGKCLVMPKVKMDSKTVIENLRTDIARGELGGVLYSTEVTMGSDATAHETGLFFMKNGKNFTIGDVTISIAANGTVTVTSSIPTVTITAASSSASTDSTTTISATGTVECYETADWVSASESSGTITVSWTANLSTSPRSARIEVYDGSTLAKIIIVNQPGAE